MNTEFITLENQIDLKVWLQSGINECDAQIGWREDYLRNVYPKEEKTEILNLLLKRD